MTFLLPPPHRPRRVLAPELPFTCITQQHDTAENPLLLQPFSSTVSLHSAAGPPWGVSTPNSSICIMLAFPRREMHVTMSFYHPAIPRAPHAFWQSDLNCSWLRSPLWSCTSLYSASCKTNFISGPANTLAFAGKELSPFQPQLPETTYFATVTSMWILQKFTGSKLDPSEKL